MIFESLNFKSFVQIICIPLILWRISNMKYFLDNTVFVFVTIYFSLYVTVLIYIISHITCPSPFAALVSTPGFVWCLLGALLGYVGELRPVNVAFTLLLIFILVFFGLFVHFTRHLETK
jgi:hypothetical protein